MKKQLEEKGLQLEDLKVSNLPELQGWREKQEKLVAENPYVEIIDNKTYEIACKSRTALLKGRTELEKQDKLIASKLAAFRKDVKTETDALVAITLPSEEKQQTEVKRYETIKEAEKQEKERIERERVEKIKSKIDLFESDSYRIIQETNISNVELNKTMLDAFVNAEFDYEEYDVLFEQARSRIQASWDAKCTDIQEKEEQRLENERMKQDIFNVRVIRFKELGFELEDDIMFRSVELPHTYTKSELLNIDSATFERAIENLKQVKKELEQSKIDAENLERENKAKADKEKIFEIRKSRLVEIGLFEAENGWFESVNKDSLMNLEFVYNCDEIGFEEAVLESIEAIKIGNKQREEAEKQKALDLQLAKEDAECLKKENKARVKRLAGDKKFISDALNVGMNGFNYVSENQEIKDFIENANAKIQSLKNELLTELEKL